MKKILILLALSGNAFSSHIDDYFIDENIYKLCKEDSLGVYSNYTYSEKKFCHLDGGHEVGFTTETCLKQDVIAQRIAELFFRDCLEHKGYSG